MRKFLVLVAVAAGIIGYRKYKESSAEKATWSRGTDKVN
ncbi:DLW-39 family protein [Arthrobacter sp. AQ5-05]|nr:DLW-39 family protein [Arthrobacter sp. AQ5-05]